jgi:hypothetical protein
MKNKVIVIIIFLTILVFIGNQRLFAADKGVALQFLNKLHIEVTGPAEQEEEYLPTEFTGPYWGLIKNMCKDSGWDLPAYAGRQVLTTRFPIKEKYGADPLEITVISSGDVIICAWELIKNPSVAPGLLPVQNPQKKTAVKPL